MQLFIKIFLLSMVIFLFSACQSDYTIEGSSNIEPETKVFYSAKTIDHKAVDKVRSHVPINKLGTNTHIPQDKINTAEELRYEWSVDTNETQYKLTDANSSLVVNGGVKFSTILKATMQYSTFDKVFSSVKLPDSIPPLTLCCVREIK